jgi:hypothetical protein
MTLSFKHLSFIGIALTSLVLAWMHGIAWIEAGGNLLNLPSFFLEAYASGSAAAFLTIDILAAWAAFMIWVVPDATRIGLGARTGWTFLALSFLGTCFAFPIYLVVRERHLSRKGNQG